MESSPKAAPPPYPKSSSFALLHHSRLATLSQMLIEFTVADSRDQRVDHGWQPVERRHSDCRLALLELDRLQPRPNEHPIDPTWFFPPPHLPPFLLSTTHPPT